MINFNKQIQARLYEILAISKLYISQFTGNQIWDIYIDSFPKEYNPIFRDPKSTVKNCNMCKNTLRRYGNIIGIDADGNIMTLYDNITDSEYTTVSKKMAESLKNSIVQDVFLESYSMLKELQYENCTINQDQYQLGKDKNVKRYTKEEAELYGVVKANEIRTFNHIHFNIPKTYVVHDILNTRIATHRDNKTLFSRAMQEISLDTLHLVEDLIHQGSLLDSTQHLIKIQEMIKCKTEYANQTNKENWCWVKSYDFPYSRFKNELIGTLCTELTEDQDITKACLNWNKRVDPVNYMKTTAPITKGQIKEAEEFITNNGYLESFNRRFAKMDDIKVTEILHSNISTKVIKAISIFDSVKPTATSKKKDFDNIDTISIEKFMKDILPTSTSIEAFLSNTHTRNMVSLTTAIENSKPIFKWNNNYSWTYINNLSGVSQIKENVKLAGGSVDGVLRFSLIWNDTDARDGSDLDAWCLQPNKLSISFNSGYRKDRGNIFTTLSGQLDLDNMGPTTNIGIENIYFSTKSKMIDGDYKFYVNQYSARNSQGFKAEIEFEGEIFTYEYNKPLLSKNNVVVATVTLRDGKFSITHNIPLSNSVQKEVYGLTTNEFHKVNLICLSPNHWKDSVGNKHYFFMLDKCKADTKIRSFHNDNLIGDLIPHRKIMEVLGNTTMIEPTDDQLSGIGFNETVRDELIVKVQGTHQRMLKIKF